MNRVSDSALTDSFKHGPAIPFLDSVFSQGGSRRSPDYSVNSFSEIPSKVVQELLFGRENFRLRAMEFEKVSYRCPLLPPFIRRHLKEDLDCLA